MKEKEIMKFVNSKAKENNVSNYSIAKKLSVSQSTVANWLNGTTYPGLHHFIQLCELLDVKVTIS